MLQIIQYNSLTNPKLSLKLNSKCGSRFETVSRTSTYPHCTAVMHLFLRSSYSRSFLLKSTGKSDAIQQNFSEFLIEHATPNRLTIKVKLGYKSMFWVWLKEMTTSTETRPTTSMDDLSASSASSGAGYMHIQKGSKRMPKVFDFHSGRKCPTCAGTGKIPKGQSRVVVMSS